MSSPSPIPKGRTDSLLRTYVLTVRTSVGNLFPNPKRSSLRSFILFLRAALIRASEAQLVEQKMCRVDLAIKLVRHSLHVRCVWPLMEVPLSPSLARACGGYEGGGLLFPSRLPSTPSLPPSPIHHQHYHQHYHQPKPIHQSNIQARFF